MNSKISSFKDHTPTKNSKIGNKIQVFNAIYSDKVLHLVQMNFVIFLIISEKKLVREEGCETLKVHFLKLNKSIGIVSNKPHFVIEYG